MYTASTQTLSAGCWFSFVYLESNNIRAGDFILIPNTVLKKLKEICLSIFINILANNGIGSVGAKLLIKAELDLLEKLQLSIY